MQHPPAKFKTSINSLPLIHREVTQLVQAYRDLQRKITSQNQLNLTNRLQQTHHKIRNRIIELDVMYAQHVADPRVRFLQILKLELCKAISPKDELNQIADQESMYSGAALSTHTGNIRSPILVKESPKKLSTSRNKPSPTRTSITPTKSVKAEMKSKTPIKPAVKVPTLNVKSISKPFNHSRMLTQESELDAKMRRYNQLELQKQPVTSQRTPTRKPQQRTLLRKEVSQRFDQETDKRAHLDSLQQLRLTIKMTREEYQRFVKQVESEGLDF